MGLIRISSFMITALMLIQPVFNACYAQQADTVSSLAITGYVDAYYAYYTDSVGAGNLQKFPNTSPRSNSFSLNTAQLSVDYNAEKIRAKTILHFGDFPVATWSPAPFTNVMEAHAGIKVFDNVWIEGGFFRAHFGTEYLLPVENLTSSVAVCTYYSPYYESGIKFSFNPVKKLDVNIYLLNGYNTFIDNNDKKSLGISAFYAFWENGGVGYTNYIGDETAPADPVAHLRMHHNVSVNYQVNKIKIQAGGDYCTQQNSDIATGSKSATMYTALVTLKYQWTKKFALSGRGELFSDPEGWMSGVITDQSGKLTGLKLWGITASTEYKPTDLSYVRLEGRMIQMDKDQYIFTHNGAMQNARYEIMLNAGVSFALLKRFKTNS